MIQIKHLKKSFGDHIIFEDFSLEIPDREFIVFTGPSGCGKTTLLNMIGGIEQTNGGEILVDGLNIAKTKNLRTYYQKHVGFLFQNFALVERKTVAENLNMIRRNNRTQLTIEQVLERVGMQGTEKQYIYSLSGGEQQRIALARLMLKQCNLVLADEPTGSLDRENAKHVMGILKSLHEMGKTVIIVTHDETLIEDNMKRIVLSKTTKPASEHKTV